MGVRPEAHLVFGIDNLDRDVDADGLYISDFILFGGTERRIGDVFFIPIENTLKNVVGLKVDSIGDKKILRAFMLCMPEAFGGFFSDGCIEFPIVPRDELFMHRNSGRVDTASIPDNQMYDNGMYEMVEHWRRVVHDGLRKLGVKRDKESLKLLLVWGWQ